MFDSESSDDNSVEIHGVKKFMHIDLPKNFNPNKAPTNGLEYLHHAIYERKKCRAVATADIDTSKFNQMCTVTQDENDQLEPAESLLPTQAWQKQKVEQFTKFRNYVQRKLPVLSEAENPAHMQLVDKMEDEYPKFSIASKINARTQVIMLLCLAKILQKIPPGRTVSDHMGVWIYTILSIIKTPMSPDMCAALRKLARQCHCVRSKLPADAAPEMYTHLNFFICIIGIYFKQFDLADKHD